MDTNVELVFAGWKGLSILIVYGLLMLAIGIYVFLKEKNLNESMSEYFLGGRSMSLVVLFFTFFATSYSGNTVIGFAPKAYRLGFSWIQAVTGMICVIAALMIFAPKLYKLSKEHNFITPADWIQHRFKSKLVTITATLLMMYALANFILAQIVAIGQGVAGLTGSTIPYQFAVVFFVVIMVAYSWLGGMRSVAYTDLIQGIILFLGIIILLFGVLNTFGGLPEATEFIKSSAPEKISVPDTNHLGTWLSTLLIWGLGSAMYPQLIQRVYAASSAKVLKSSLSKMIWAPFLVTFPVLIIGLISIKAFPGLGKLESEQLIGVLANHIANQSTFYYWAMIVLFGGIISAIVSTADSALLSYESFVSQDIYGRFLNHNASDAKKVKAGKLVGLITIVILVMIAWNPPATLYEIFVIKFELLIQVAPLFFIGIYWQGLHKRAAWLGMMVGTVMVLWMTLTHFSYLGIYNGLWALALNLLVALLGSFVLNMNSSSQLTQKLTDN